MNIKEMTQGLSAEERKALIEELNKQEQQEQTSRRDVQSDLRVRRAKTKGHVVIETKDVMFASLIQRYYPNCKVNIKE